MPNQRQHAKVISFANIGAQPFERPLDPDALQHFQDVIHLHQQEPNRNGDRFEYTILKRRDATDLMGKTSAALEARARVREGAATDCRPTAWERLIEDDGLG